MKYKKVYCPICKKYYDLNDLILINGDLAECKFGHNIDLTSFQFLNLNDYNEMLNLIGDVN